MIFYKNNNEININSYDFFVGKSLHGQMTLVEYTFHSTAVDKDVSTHLHTENLHQVPRDPDSNERVC